MIQNLINVSRRCGLIFITIFNSVFFVQPISARPFVFDDQALALSEGIFVDEQVIDSVEFRGTRWQHILAMAWDPHAKPADHALVLVMGGDVNEIKNQKNRRLIDQDRQRLIGLARLTRLPVAILRQIPNQPILNGKREDEAISHTLMRYFETDDPTWPLLHPMVKSVSIGLDAIEDLAAAKIGLKIRGFTLSGESKRGWTTWLTAAADPRVKALAPAVFDILSMRAQLRHQLVTWGQYSEQIGDYSEQGLPKMLETQAGERLLKMIDPISFAGRLTQPKLIILATNDRYWPLDALNLYWPNLKGPKYAYYLPQASHDLTDKSKIDENLAILARSAAGLDTLPRLDFSSTSGPTLTITSDRRPDGARIWRANSQTRDFRDSIWYATPLAAPGKSLRMTIPSEPNGMTATYVELWYEIAGAKLHLSTTITITDQHGNKI